MKSRMLSLLVAGVVCALMFVGWTVYAEKPKKPNKVWEYKVVRLCATENDLNMFGKHAGSPERFLNVCQR